MTQIGLMLEGQDGLNWTRWFGILKTAEEMGYQCVFRSDHFTNASGEDLDSLELWTSLTYMASHTQKLEFGPLVTPITFRHPAMTLRNAAAVDDLSGGRLILGMGAGWQAREHRKFGVPFYDVPTRHAMLSEGLELVKLLLENDQHVSFTGKYFSLDEAVLLPRPKRKIPILIGGNGLTKTLPLVAQYADEWNAVFITLENYQERAIRLNELLDAQGRARDSVKRSLMTEVVYEKTDAALKKRLEGRDMAAIEARGIIVGTGQSVVDQLGKWVEAGIERFMLQWLNQDNLQGIEDMAADVLPHFHK